jgi:heat-inducible transcriptional repressor
MSRKPLSKKERRTIDDVFVNVEVDVEKFLGRISGALALMTNCVSLTTTPVSKAAIFSSIELIPLGRRTFILIFVTAPGIVRDKICRLDAEPGSELCERFIKAVNEQLCRTSVENITPAFIQTLGITLGELGLLFSPVLYEIYKAAQAVLEGRIILEGCTNLLAHREFAGDPKAVMDFLGRQDILRDMLIRNNESTSVIIGSELGGLNNMPIGFIVSKYSVKGDTAGSVGIIGPSRLDYSKIIPYIEYFAELMGKLLTDALNENEE